MSKFMSQFDVQNHKTVSLQPFWGSIMNSNIKQRFFSRNCNSWTVCKHKLPGLVSTTTISHAIHLFFYSFSVDDNPIRVFKNSKAKGVPYPNSQPMGVYATLWEADDWATRGGLEKINWSKAPFYAYYKDFDIEGCIVLGPASCSSNPNNWWEGPHLPAAQPPSGTEIQVGPNEPPHLWLLHRQAPVPSHSTGMHEWSFKLLNVC